MKKMVIPVEGQMLFDPTYTDHELQIWLKQMESEPVNSLALLQLIEKALSLCESYELTGTGIVINF